MARKKHYAVCYAHVCKWASASSMSEACNLAFGLVDYERMTVRECPSNPRYMSYKKRQEFLVPLFARHKEKTGSVIE